MKSVKAQPIKWPVFARRLQEACDAHPDCPPLHKGRQVWLREKLSDLGVDVEIESVRKWLSGIVRPRQDKAEALAQILNIDPLTLFLGWEPNIQPKIEKITGDIAGRSDELPITIRPDLTVRVSGLPFDLTHVEAKRIANIILAHAVAVES